MLNLPPALRNFYFLYLEWVWRGAPDTIVFRRCDGLCGNLSYMPHLKIMSWEESESAKFIQRELFASHGLNPMFPFGVHTYHKQKHYNTLHQCPRRLSWVAYCLNLLSSPKNGMDHSAFHLPYTHPPGASLPPPYFPIPDLPAQFFASDGSRKVLADFLVPSDHHRHELPAYGPRDYLLDDSPEPRKSAVP